MNFSISGEVLEEPVLSRKSGLLFDKPLIDCHISEYGKYPVTREELAMNDLVPVKAGKIVSLRPMQATRIPGMLNIFHNEWDTLMLSHFSWDKQLHIARDDLSHALYQTAAHDGVRLWDLRKLKNFCVSSPYNEDTPTNSVEFDHSRLYLTIAGSDLRLGTYGPSGIAKGQYLTYLGQAK